MTASSTDYLHALACQLHLEPTQEQEIITELQSHIEDTATDLEAQGGWTERLPWPWPPSS